MGTIVYVSVGSFNVAIISQIIATFQCAIFMKLMSGGASGPLVCHLLRYCMVEQSSLNSTGLRLETITVFDDVDRTESIGIFSAVGVLPTLQIRWRRRSVCV